MSEMNYLKVFDKSPKRPPKLGSNAPLVLVLLSFVLIGVLGLLTWGGLTIAAKVADKLLSSNELVVSAENRLDGLKSSIAGIDAANCGDRLSQMADVSTWLELPFRQNLNSLRQACFGPAKLECAKDLSCDSVESSRVGVKT